MATVYLTGTRPMVRPNGPRPSRHALIVETDRPLRFYPRRAAERVWPALAGLSWPHPRGAPYDLVHAFNAIPLTDKPWLTTFESVLPRALGPLGTPVAHALRERLLRDNCRTLIAMSRYARGKLVKANRGWTPLDRVLAKVTVVYPHFDARPATVRRAATPLRLLFVGNDFARKGGIVALRAVAQATARGLPVHLDVVSGFRLAGAVYTDHPDRARYAADLRLLDHPAVTVHGRLDNSAVLALMASAHVQLLPTLDDTFGYSVIEGFSVGTPALVSNVCAMPELVPPEAGATLALEVDEWGNWLGLGQRTQENYWEILNETFDALAQQVVQHLTVLIHEPARVEQWSEGALERFREFHESRAISARLDDLYDAALN